LKNHVNVNQSIIFEFLKKWIVLKILKNNLQNKNKNYNNWISFFFCCKKTF
jgi:hypothetical protein